jgi:hypothetical protein
MLNKILITFKCQYYYRKIEKKITVGADQTFQLAIERFQLTNGQS